MDLGRIVKWLVILGLIFVAWKVVVPWVKKQGLPSAAGAATEADTPCVRAAAEASERWGSGLARFANPNPDATQWQTFRGMVEGRIGSAESACSCETASCAKARDAMRDLRGVVSDMDNALRANTGPPGDIVQRQESIDNAINEARDLARQ
jgi:hypothetical protein